MSGLPALLAEASPDQLKAFREQMLNDLPEMARIYTEQVKMDASPGAFRDWFTTAGNVVPGVKIDSKGLYDNIQSLSFVMNLNSSIEVTAVRPAEIISPNEDITDVLDKTPGSSPLPLPEVDAETQELLDLFKVVATPLE